MKGNSKSRGVYAEGTSFLTRFYAVLCLRGSMLKVSSWLETARYERFLGKKQHIMGIIGGRIVML